MPAEKKRSPAKRPLTRERVVSTAIKLADNVGILGLTMRKIADNLGVEAMSLYHHMPNKDAILDAMVDQIFNEIYTPATDVPWRNAIRARAHSARETLVRHPWAVSILESRRNPGPRTLAHHNAVIGCLRKGGFSVPQTANAYSLIDSFIYGFVMQEITLPFKTGEEARAVAAMILAGLPEDTYPHLAELTREHVLKDDYDYGKEFHFGLELVLDGLEQLKSGAKA